MWERGLTRGAAVRLVRVAVLASATAATMLAAASAGSAATLTYPSNGATVSLDAKASFSFQWSLSPGEVGPTVWVGDTPAYEAGTLAPFKEGCASKEAEERITSCSGEEPLEAGTHYAFIVTHATPPAEETVISPVTSFVVPPMLAFGCGPKSGGCPMPTGVESLLVAHPPIGYPSSTWGATVWLNREDAPVSFSFTVSHGSRVLLRVHHVVNSMELAADSGFVIEKHKDRYHLGEGRYGHWPAPAGGTRLTVSEVITAGGLTLRHRGALIAPAATG
jgi:hypothetical protein